MKAEKHEKLLKLADSRMSEAKEFDADSRKRSLDDLRVLNGKDHWEQQIKDRRKGKGQPCLTINRLPQFVRQVTGDIRRMNPNIRIIPGDKDATKQVADIYAGLIRQIEQDCDASATYEQAAESAAACSMGTFRVLTDYVDDSSFDQEIKIERIRNALSVYFDPASQKPTREDSGYCFITEKMSVEKFKDRYPNAADADASHDTLTDGLHNWHEEGAIVVAEYFWKEPVARTLVELPDGETVFKDDIEGDFDLSELRTRTVNSHQVMWAKISGSDVLEGPKRMPGKHIPVIAVTGEEWDIGDEVYRSSVIRFAKDAQKSYNYFRSAAAETVAVQPRAPYIGTLEQFAGLEKYWAAANIDNQAFLPYKPDPQAPGAPQRQQPPVSSQGFSQEAIMASEDMKATTGIYDAALGEQSNEVSGVAIRQRQVESDVSTSIYTDNMAKAIRHCGRILVSMIPEVYDTQRVIRILGEDGKDALEKINDAVIEGGKVIPVNSLSLGRYDVRIDVGPNYSTRRQETAEGMMSFLQAFPGASGIIGDLVAKAMDWPDAEKIAERLEKMLPPNVRNQDGLTPQELQAQQQAMQQQQQQMQMAQKAQLIEIHKAAAEGQEAQSDALKAQFEAERERLELLAQSGALDGLIAEQVNQQVTQLLMGAKNGTPIAHQGAI